MTSSLDKLINWRIQEHQDTAIGYIASEPYQLHDPGEVVWGEDNRPYWQWCVDVEVDFDNEILRGVPIATNNKDIFYADLGRAVQLRKISNKWYVVGLAKRKKGLKRIVCLRFTDDTAEIIDDRMEGRIYRRLTYTELGSIPGKYGVFPYGAIGIFDADGNFLELVRRT